MSLRLAHCVRAVFPQHGYGGLERAASALTNHLLERGVNVDLFTRPLPRGEPFKTPPNAAGGLAVHGIRYGGLPLRANSIAARLTNYRVFVGNMGKRVEAMARKGYIDGVYAQGLCTRGVRNAGFWGVPVVANPQGLEEFKVQDPFKRLAYAPFRAWVRAGCRAADRVIATDQATRGEVSALLGVDPARVVVIPNGVDMDEARGYLDSAVQAALVLRWPALGTGDAVVKGISVGRLEQNKGFDILLKALRLLPDALEGGWMWVVVGEGSQKARLKEMAAGLGLSERVHFAGRLSDAELHNLYELSSLFVHPTLYEGSSLVTLEAMAHGLAVVASKVGGIPDKVLDGETGFLVPPADASALAAKIAWLSQRPGEREVMGAHGKALAAAHFGWDSIAAQTEQLFARLANERAACRPEEVVP